MLSRKEMNRFIQRFVDFSNRYSKAYHLKKKSDPYRWFHSERLWDAIMPRFEPHDPFEVLAYLSLIWINKDFSEIIPQQLFSTKWIDCFDPDDHRLIIRTRWESDIYSFNYCITDPLIQEEFSEREVEYALRIRDMLNLTPLFVFTMADLYKVKNVKNKVAQQSVEQYLDSRRVYSELVKEHYNDFAGR